MNERRRFLQMVSGGTVALAGACGGSSKSGGTGGDGTGGEIATDTSSSSSASTASSSSGSSVSGTSSSSSGGCTESPAGKKLGKPTDYMEGLVADSTDSIFVGRDSGGLYCLTSICTHQACDMSQMGLGAVIDGGTEIACYCHGSRYDADGKVLVGGSGQPASMQKPLKAYALALGCDGFVYVDMSTVVASTVRLKA